MNAISDFLNTGAAKPQSAEEAILTICDRLNNATLISDRRAAVLSLKAFSRQYRESVVAHGLRGLIAALAAEGSDLETVKSILKTLLILFVKTDGTVDSDDDAVFAVDFRDRNLRIAQDQPHGVSSIDQISLFVSDELLASGATVAVLTQLLSTTTDFYVKLYVLQILELLASARPVRCKDQLLASPLSLSVIVGALDEQHEPIRNEAVLLLTSLAVDNSNVQKLVAFENIFDKLFAIVDLEGALRGSLVVGDCLDLLHELLRYNASNQKLFVESLFVPRLAALVNQPLTDADFFWNDQRIANSTKVIRLAILFVADNHRYQKTLADNHLVLILLQLAFTLATPNQVRAQALLAIAHIVDSDADLQLRFSQIDVPYIDPSQPTARKSAPAIPVVQALLNWVLYCNSIHTFDVRVAAEILLEGYFEANVDAQIAFVDDQIADFKSSASSTDTGSPRSPADVPAGNIFQTLFEYDSDWKLNPYRTWFSCVLLARLARDNEAVKDTLRALKIGDETAGEEVLTSTQVIQEKLSASLELDDPRVPIAYLMLLTFWLFLDKESCDFFLKEYSNVISIMSYVSQAKSSTDFAVVDAMIVVMVGVVYDSTTGQSSISRTDLHALISKTIGEDNYALKIRAFKESKMLATVSETSLFQYKKDASTGLPEVYLTLPFKQFFLDIYPRIRRLKSPAVEPIGVISYDVLDQLESTGLSLKTELEAANRLIEERASEIAQNETQITQLREKLATIEADADSISESESRAKEQIASLQAELAALAETHANLESVSSKYYTDLQSSTKEASSLEQKTLELQTEVDTLREAKKKAEDGINKMSRELFQLSREKEGVEKKLKQAENDLTALQKKSDKAANDLNRQLKAKEDKIASLTKANTDLAKEVQDLKDREAKLSAHVEELQSSVGELKATNNSYVDKFRLSSKVIDEFKDQNAELTKKFEALTLKTNNEIYGLKSNVDSLKAKLAGLTKENEDLQAQLKAAAQETETLKAQAKDKDLKHSDLSSVVGKLQADLAAVSASKNELEGQHRSLAAEHSSLRETHESALQTHESTIKGVNEEQQSKTEEIAELNRAKVSLESELADLKSSSAADTKAKAGQIAALEKKLDGAVAERDSLKQALADETARFQKQIDDLERSAADLKQQHASVAAELSAAKDSHSTGLKGLEEALAAAESRHAAVVAEKEQLASGHDATNKEMETRLQTHATRVAELETQLESAVKERDAISAEAEKAKEYFEDRIAGLEDDVDALIGEKNELQEEYDAFKIQEKKGFADLKEQKESILQEKNSLSSTLEMISQKMNESDQKLTEARAENNALLKESGEKSESLETLQRHVESEEKKHRAKISSLEAEIGQIRQEVADKEKEIEVTRENLSKDSESVVQSYIEQIKDLEKDKTKIREESGSLKSKIEELETRVAELAEKETSQAGANLKLKDESAALQTELEAKSAALTKSTAELEDLKKQLESAQNEHRETQKTWKSREVEIGDAKGAAETKVTKLESELASLQEAMQTATNAHEEAKGQLEKTKKENKTKMEEQRKDKKSVETELEKAKAKLDQLSKDLEVVKSERDSLKSEIEESTESLGALKSKSSEAAAEKQELTKSVKQLQEELEQVKSASAKDSKAKSDLEQQLASLSKDLDEVKTQKTEAIKELEREKDKLSAQVEELKKANDDTVQELKAANDKLSAEAEELRTSSKTAQADAESAMAKKVAALEAKMSSMVPKGDLDDLFFLMKETKREYKERLIKLGEEVSSDEEDDDEDDDEDEEDEE